MTEQYTQKKNRFFVSNAYVEPEDWDADIVEINKIVVELIGYDVEKRSLALYPRREKLKEKKVDGRTVKKPVEVPHTFDSLPENLDKLVSNAGNMPKGQTIVVDGTVTVNEYEDGNIAYRMWQNMISSDSFNLEVVEGADATSNPADLNKIRSKQKTEDMAEEYAEDVEGMDSEEKSEEKEEAEALF